MAEELLEHHTNVDVINAEGSTALHWAARRDQHAIIKLLLAHGASVHLENKWGLTPLAVAQQNGNEHSVVALTLWMKTLEASHAIKTPSAPTKVAPQVRALSQEERAKREARKEEGKARAAAAKDKLQEEQAAKAQHAAALREQVKCEKKVRCARSHVAT